MLTRSMAWLYSAARLNTREIAELFGISDVAVQRRLRRAGYRPGHRQLTTIAAPPRVAP